VTPKDKLKGRENMIFAERKHKLEQARERRIQVGKQVEDKLIDIPQSTAITTAILYAA